MNIYILLFLAILIAFYFILNKKKMNMLSLENMKNQKIKEGLLGAMDIGQPKQTKSSNSDNFAKKNFSARIWGGFGTGKNDICQGDVDHRSNADCKSGLKELHDPDKWLWQKYCNGSSLPRSGFDFCIPKSVTLNKKLKECEHDCFENDNNCESGLKCKSRASSGTRNVAVPGCTGSYKEGASYCYDPNKVNSVPSITDIQNKLKNIKSSVSSAIKNKDITTISNNFDTTRASILTAGAGKNIDITKAKNDYFAFNDKISEIYHLYLDEISKNDRLFNIIGYNFNEEIKLRKFIKKIANVLRSEDEGKLLIDKRNKVGWYGDKSKFMVKLHRLNYKIKTFKILKYLVSQCYVDLLESGEKAIKENNKNLIKKFNDRWREMNKLSNLFEIKNNSNVQFELPKCPQENINLWKDEHKKYLDTKVSNSVKWENRALNNSVNTSHGDVCRNVGLDGKQAIWDCPIGCEYANNSVNSPYCLKENSNAVCHLNINNKRNDLITNIINSYFEKTWKKIDLLMGFSYGIDKHIESKYDNTVGKKNIQNIVKNAEFQAAELNNKGGETLPKDTRPLKYFHHEINYILSPPHNKNDTRKIGEYGYVYKVSDNAFTFIENIEWKDATGDSSPPSNGGAYMKVKNDNILKDSNLYWSVNGGIDKWKSKTFTEPGYHRIRFPFWGFVRGNFNTVIKEANVSFSDNSGYMEGFGNFFKNNKLAQKINKRKTNRFDSVVNFFKNKVFNLPLYEGNAVMADTIDKPQPTTNIETVKFIKEGNPINIDEDSTNKKKEIFMIDIIINETKHRWYKLSLKALNETIVDGTPLDELLNYIVKDTTKNNIYKYPSTVSITQDNLTKFAEKAYVNKVCFQSFDGCGDVKNWNKDNFIQYIMNGGDALDHSYTPKNEGGGGETTENNLLIELYFNDDGHSAIVFLPQRTLIQNMDDGPINHDVPSLLHREVLKKLTNFVRNSSNASIIEDKMFIHVSEAPFSLNSDQSGYNINTEAPFPSIENRRGIIILPRGLINIKMKGDADKNICPTDFSLSTSDGAISGHQMCKSNIYSTDCYLAYSNFGDKQSEQIPRCFEYDGTTINKELKNYKVDCENIPGMKADPNDQSKCITNPDHSRMTGMKDEHLRSCYLYKDGLTEKCSSEKEGKDCICDFSPSFDADGEIDKTSGKPIVEDSYCKAMGDVDLTWGECEEYARWKLADDKGNVKNNFIAAKYFNVETDKTGEVKKGTGWRKGCQMHTTIPGGPVDKDEATPFIHVEPSQRYGSKSRKRNWGDNELATLEELKKKSRSICKTDYLQEQRMNIAKQIDDTPEEIVTGINIPGLPSKDGITGEPIIVNASSTDLANAKNNCDGNISWDSCFMTGNKEAVNKGKSLIDEYKDTHDIRYLEYKLYNDEDETKEETKEGFMGFRKKVIEGAVGTSGGCLKNCAPVNRISGNCDDDVKVSKDTNNVQRFFKLCPQECLTPLDPRYEDIDKSGTMNDDGTKVIYDANIHGCQRSSQCQETCSKTEVQVKHVYDNRCESEIKDKEFCSINTMKSQYDSPIVGKIKYNNTLTISQVKLDEQLIDKYMNNSISDGNEKRENAVFSYIEDLKKKSDGNIIGVSFLRNEPDDKAKDIVLIIFKKKNMNSKLEYDKVDGNKWNTYIHLRSWKNFWYNADLPTMADIEGALNEDDMARMQGLNLGISETAFEKIPLFWEMDQTKEASSNRICEWVDDKIKAGVLSDKDACSAKFKSTWDARALGLGKTPTKGLNFEEFEEVFNLKAMSQESSPYTDMSNQMDIGQKDLSLDDYYKRNLLSSKVENRLGGSSNAYTKTYKPINPNATPRFFNSAWGLFH